MANLKNISQICDKNYSIQFTNNHCIITNPKGKCLVRETRSYDNYHYIVVVPSITSNLANNDSASLWHQKMGHINFKNLVNLSKKEIVHDLSTLSKTGQNILWTYQLEKKCSPHKKIKGVNTI